MCQNGGASALFYHNTTYISPHNQDFRDVLGAVTEQHPPLRPFKVKIVNHEHPITKGVNDFVVTDEQHFVKYDKDPKYVLMQSVNEDGLTWRDHGTSSVAGWAYDYGKGRTTGSRPCDRGAVEPRIRKDTEERGEVVTARDINVTR